MWQHGKWVYSFESMWHILVNASIRYLCVCVCVCVYIHTYIQEPLVSEPCISWIMVSLLCTQWIWNSMQHKLLNNLQHSLQSYTCFTAPCDRGCIEHHLHKLTLLICASSHQTAVQSPLCVSFPKQCLLQFENHTPVPWIGVRRIGKM